MRDQSSRFVEASDAVLLTDLYELTMLRAYFEEGLTRPAVFSLFARRLPPQRNYLLACGLEEVLSFLERARFDERALGYLRALELFPESFLSYLAQLRFEGDVYALPEGTPFFAEEPVLQVAAPLPQAQWIETFVLNQIHLSTLLASKAGRVVAAARGRPVVDFGARRMQGVDAALKSARAFSIAGVEATSNLLGARRWQLRAAGTMAHSYIQAHDSELEAFRQFAARYPRTTLLVDTYDTLAGIGKVIQLAQEAKGAFAIRGVRLDSGDLAWLSFESRRRLDQAGLREVKIFASGGLDEYAIERLLSVGAPIDAFGVGTAMGVSSDAPTLDLAYKLVAYDGIPRTKLSPEKRILPGLKQVFRREAHGRAFGDTLDLMGANHPGRPLIKAVMKEGARTAAGQDTLSEARTRAAEEVARLPDSVRGLSPSEYPLEIGRALQAIAREAERRAFR